MFQQEGKDLKRDLFIVILIWKANYSTSSTGGRLQQLLFSGFLYFSCSLIDHKDQHFNQIIL